jgi:ATP-binding cassette subfamily G (WHITE) protein 1
MIGSPEKKGISGGERRRVSVAMEMVRNPSILFLDEPTSGLDSFTAYSVAHLLKSVAQQHQRTIVATIHQPSSEIWSLFDDLCLLHQGRVIFHGPASEAMPYFDAYLGYHIPMFNNPADFIFMHILNARNTFGKRGSVVAAAQQSQQQQQGAEGAVVDAEAEREKRIISMWNDVSPKTGEPIEPLQRLLTDLDTNSVGRDLPDRAQLLAEGATLYTQFYFLCLRAIRDVARNPYKMRARFGQCMFVGMFVGLCYLQVRAAPCSTGPPCACSRRSCRVPLSAPMD